MPKAETLGDIGAKRNNLSNEESSALERAFERSLEDTRIQGEEVVLRKMREYSSEIEIAAQVAKSELSGSFDGQAPSSGNFGLDTIHPGYFGYDDWDAIPDLTGGDVNDWLDSHTPSNLASGSGGNSFADPLGVGDHAVHVIVGFGSYSADPVVTRIKQEKNDNPFPAVTTEDAFRNTDLRVKWLDTPVVLQPDDDYSARVFCGGEVGNTYSEAVYPLGLTFLEARAYRILDPASMAGTDQSNIVVQR